MKSVLKILLLAVCISGCSKSPPPQEDYLGVYRIIKIDDGGDGIIASTLTQIELTDNLYISSFDRNGDNKFSSDEVSKSTYVYGWNEAGEPQITVTGNDSVVRLLSDNYYDLLMKRIDGQGRETTLYLRKVR